MAKPPKDLDEYSDGPTAAMALRAFAKTIDKVGSLERVKFRLKIWVWHPDYCRTEETLTKAQQERLAPRG